MTAVQIVLCYVLLPTRIVPASIFAISGGEFAAVYVSHELPSARAMEFCRAWNLKPYGWCREVSDSVYRQG